MAKDGTFSKVSRSTWPLEHSARTRTRPAGASSTSFVTGSTSSTMPVSSSTKAVFSVFVPDMPSYDEDSMITKPASASGFDDGRITSADRGADPRGS